MRESNTSAGTKEVINEELTATINAILITHLTELREIMQKNHKNLTTKLQINSKVVKHISEILIDYQSNIERLSKKKNQN